MKKTKKQPKKYSIVWKACLYTQAACLEGSTSCPGILVYSGNPWIALGQQKQFTCAYRYTQATQTTTWFGILVYWPGLQIVNAQWKKMLDEWPEHLLRSILIQHLFPSVIRDVELGWVYQYTQPSRGWLMNNGVNHKGLRFESWTRIRCRILKDRFRNQWGVWCRYIVLAQESHFPILVSLTLEMIGRWFVDTGGGWFLFFLFFSKTFVLNLDFLSLTFSSFN